MLPLYNIYFILPLLSHHPYLVCPLAYPLGFCRLFDDGRGRLVPIP